MNTNITSFSFLSPQRAYQFPASSPKLSTSSIGGFEAHDAQLAGAASPRPGPFHSKTTETSLGGYGGAQQNAVSSVLLPQTIQRPWWHSLIERALKRIAPAMLILSLSCLCVVADKAITKINHTRVIYGK